MKHLFLLRHGHSGEKMSAQNDKDRELSTSGVRQSIAVGMYLKERAIHIDAIISSSSKRTQATAQFVAEGINFNPDAVILSDDLYQASVGKMLDIIHAADNHQKIMIVGHNPTISYFADFIAGTEVSEMPTGTLLEFSTSIQSWNDLGRGTASLVDQFVP